MSIDFSGTNSKISAQTIVVTVRENHPLIQLGQALPWAELIEMVLPDLKASTKGGKWWMGRPLCLRIHIGVYVLQQLFNKTDRQTEYDLKDNAAYQIFCGINVVKKWHIPDHTKIEKFRSRLTPETQKKLANFTVKLAARFGFADPSHVDIDSTVQEANMSYPNDTKLLCDLADIAKRSSDYLNKNVPSLKSNPLKVDIKEVRTKARRCFFLGKGASKEKKNHHLKDLLNCVSRELAPIIEYCRHLKQAVIRKMPWNIRDTFKMLQGGKVKKYLKDVRYFIKNGKMVPDKLLSFHLNDARCITKNKPGKKYQFGRVFHLGRVMGNFLFAGRSDTPNLPDKKAMKLILDEHNSIFEKSPIKSIATDKGYYSGKNEKIAAKHGVVEIGIQRPHNVKKPRLKNISKCREEELVNRRSGIEPLIGHAKQKGQLGRSRMKFDRTIEASGFTALLGFNLRQLIRYKTGKIKLQMT